MYKTIFVLSRCETLTINVRNDDLMLSSIIVKKILVNILRKYISMLVDNSVVSYVYCIILSIYISIHSNVFTIAIEIFFTILHFFIQNVFHNFFSPFFFILNILSLLAIVFVLSVPCALHVHLALML